jgi:AcrR family transcriptional regulator
MNPSPDRRQLHRRQVQGVIDFGSILYFFRCTVIIEAFTTMASKKSSPATQPKPRAARRPRAECEELLLRAAETLLETRNPGEISIRDIAEEAHVHHRFIATWFGGKTQLFTIVHERISERVRSNVQSTPALSAPAVASLNLQLGLGLWLIQNGVSFPSLEAAFPAIGEATKGIMAARNMSEKEARSIAYTVGAIVFSDYILRPQVDVDVTMEEILAHYLNLLPKLTK